MTTTIPDAAVDYTRHDAYFRAHNPPTPCLLLDLDAAAAQLDRLTAALPGVEVYYAVKANGEPELLRLMAAAGCGFDVASPGEIDWCLAAGADPARISFGHTVKKEADIAYAHGVGVRLFAVDAAGELAKIATAAPGADVCLRLTAPAPGSQWPRSAKFGCAAETGVGLLREARRLGLNPYGITFHVGSQQRDPASWETAIAIAAEVSDALTAEGITVPMLNLGGGLPATYEPGLPGLAEYADVMFAALDKHFPVRPRLLIEPGRFLSADPGLIRSEVVLVATRDEPDGRRWVYLDAGRFSGLSETEDEVVRFPLVASRQGRPLTGPAGPAVVTGPTCDPADTMYQRIPRQLPLDLRPGDHVDFLAGGAYTAPYAAVGFNGFPPMPTFCFRGPAE